MRVRGVLAGLIAAAIALPAAAAAEVAGGGPDENVSQAYGPLQEGTTYSGAFASQSDVDYLSFVVTSAGQTIQFTVANTTQVCQDPYDAGCPVYATLMDSTGQNQVGGSDSDAGTIATYGDTEAFDWTFAQPGTYYVLIESDGDLPPGSPAYSLELSSVPGGGGGGGGGGGSSGGSGSRGGTGGGGSLVVRSLKVVPRQRGRVVRAWIVLGKQVAWLRASLLLPHSGPRPNPVATRLYRRLAAGLHRLAVRVPEPLAHKLERRQQLSLLLRIVLATGSGVRRSYTRSVTLSP